MNVTLAPSCSTSYYRNHVPSNWQTYSGMQNQYKYDGVQRLPLKRIISHPDYNQMTFDYDIALLELSEPLEFTNTIQPICLPSSSHVFPAGMACWVTGWGAQREGGILHLVSCCNWPRLHPVFFFFSIVFFFFFTLNSSQNENIPHSFHLCSSISLVSSPSVFILFFIFCSLSLQSWHTALVSFRFNLLFPH